jgi:hypothetical protein
VNETERRLLELFDALEREAIDLHAFFELAGGNTPAAQQAVLAAVDHLLAQGWLEERGGDFYARTESGRQAIVGKGGHRQA